MKAPIRKADPRTVRTALARSGGATLTARSVRGVPPPDQRPRDGTPRLEMRLPGPALSSQGLMSGGFKAPGSSAATNPPRRGDTVVLIVNIERRNGESAQVGERFVVVGHQGGAWHLRQGTRVLRNVSSFQIRWAEPEVEP